MFADERRTEIVKLVEQQQTVTVNQLTARYHVSIETIRRDLERLEQLHLLKRVHGGAVSLHKMLQFAQLEERAGHNRKGKMETAKAVVSLLHEGDRILIDSGSTAREIALLMCEVMQELTVITYSLEVMQILSQKESFHLIQVGGEFLRSERAFYGFQAEEMLRELRADKAIVCPSAVSIRQGLGDYVSELIPMQRTLIRAADNIIIAADSSKLDRVTAYQIGIMKPSYALATDSGISKEFEQNCSTKGIAIYYQ